MDCLEAQAIISQALDKVPLDDVSVEKAKLHCTGCPECNAFVRGIAATLRAGTPTPPPDLADRVMAAVRADSVSQAVTGAASLSATARSAAQPTTPAAPPAEKPAAHSRTNADGAVVNLRDPATRRSLIAWASAAAVVLVLAGVFANQGVRQILQPRDATLADGGAGGAPKESADMAQPPALSQSPQTFGSDATTTGASSTAAAGDYIALNGVAYLRAGSVPDIDSATLTKVGLTTTSLDAKTSAANVEVLGGPDPSRVYVRKPDGTLLAFDRVTREFQGRQYALQTGAITAFGMWPSFPSAVGKPTSDTGAPVFKELEPDTTGARLFEPTAGGAGLGIAVGPNSPAIDQARGNPDWTWWTPVR